jgi:hypothetical protein
MSDENAIVPGTILHWKGFKFPDGATADKFLVIVGCQKGKNYLAIVATSKQKKRSNQPGAIHRTGITTYLGEARIGFLWTLGYCSRSREKLVLPNLSKKEWQKISKLKGVCAARSLTPSATACAIATTLANIIEDYLAQQFNKRKPPEAPSDNPTYLAHRERLAEGMRKAGVP